MDSLDSKIFYLKKKVIFPHCTTDVAIKTSQTAVSIKPDERILTYPIRSLLDVVFYRGKIATLAKVISVNTKEETCTLNIQGIERVRLKKIHSLKNAEYIAVDENKDRLKPSELEKIRKKTQELVFIINVKESDKLIGLLNFLTDASQMTDFIANYFILDFRERYRLLYTVDLKKRCETVTDYMEKLIRKIKKRGQAGDHEKKHPEQ